LEGTKVPVGSLRREGYLVEKESSPILERATHAAALGIRGLMDEVRMLAGALPDLRDAFDADELLVSFILRRDARRFGAARERHDVPTPAMKAVSRKSTPHPSQRRGGHRKQVSGE
jgi:hypothetical protein